MIRFVHLLLPLSIALPLQASSDRPNVVIIYADDLGFGDVSCNGAKPGLTPNVDRLRKEGLNFTDAHTTSATCTPSRYGLLTGKYPWRKRGTGVLPGDARLIIEPGTITLASCAEKGRLSDRRRGQMAPRAWKRQARLERRDLARAARARVRRVVHHGGHRRPRPLRLYQGPSGRRPQPGQIRSRFVTISPSPACPRAGPTRNCSACTRATATTWRSSTGSAGSAS